MQRKKLMGVLALILCFGMIVPSMRAQAATTISSGSSSSGSSGSSSSGSSSSGSTWNGTTIQCEAFYYGGSYPAVYTIKNVSHGTGNQEVKLVVTTDDGTWDGYIDYLQISLEKTCLYEKNMLIY